MLGHQDKNKAFHELEVPSQLNVLMDSLSKKMVKDTARDTNHIIPMPAQKLYICCKHPIAHDIPNALIEREMNMDIKQYYEKHHKIHRRNINEIDWDATKKALTTKSEVSCRKTFHKFRNTMPINKKWKRTDCDLCPLCTSAPETIHHLLSCSHKDIEYVRTITIAKLLDTLKTLNTQPGIVSHWRHLFHNITNQVEIQPRPVSISNPASWRLRQAHQQQSRIGWENFFHGMIGTTWAEIQQNHYNKESKDGENIHIWKRIVVMKFFDLLKELWRTRCGYINAEKTMNARDMLTQRTYKLHREYNHKKELVSLLDRHLFDKQESYF